MHIPVCKKIEEISNFYRSKKPSEIEVSGIKGRIIYSQTPAGLYAQFDPKEERLPSAKELISLRNKSFFDLCQKIGAENILFGQPGTERLPALNILSEIRSNPRAYGIWQARLTTSTAMVRTENLNGADSVFFYDGDPFDNYDELANAMNKELSDGGIKYTEKALEKIKRHPNACFLPFKKYLEAKGGNFTSLELLDHPIFQQLGSRLLLENYVFALAVLNIVDFYHSGIYSLWRPGEIRSGYGRSIALGYKGETFYPPNNSTLGHAALLLPSEKFVPI